MRCVGAACCSVKGGAAGVGGSCGIMHGHLYPEKRSQRPMCAALTSLQDGGWTEEEGFAPRRKRGRMQVSGRAGLRKDSLHALVAVLQVSCTLKASLSSLHRADHGWVHRLLASGWVHAATEVGASS